MLIFLGCTTVEIKETEENVIVEELQEVDEILLDEKINLMSNKYIDDQRRLISVLLNIVPKNNIKYSNLIKRLILDEKVNLMTSKYINDHKRLLSVLSNIVPKGNSDYNSLISRLLLSRGDYIGAKNKILSIPQYNKNDDNLEIISICQMALSEDYKDTLYNILEINSENLFALNNLAKVLFISKDLKKAEELLVKSYNVDDENNETFILLGDLYLKRVDEMGLENKKVLSLSEEEEVKSLYNRGLFFYKKVENSTDPSYYVKLSSLYKKLGKKEEAILALDKAIELDPDDLWNYYDRGKLYFYKSYKLKAKEDFLNAFSIDENHFFTNVFLGRLYYAENSIDKSYFHYNKAIELNPNYSPAYMDLSVLSKIKGDDTRSLNYLISLYTNNTYSDPFFQLNLVNSLIEYNRNDDAKNILVNLVKNEKKGTMKEIYNYLLDSAKAGDDIIDEILNMKDLYQRTRLTYYISCSLKRDGKIALSEALLKEVADTGISYESKLAKYKLGEFNE